MAISKGLSKNTILLNTILSNNGWVRDLLICIWFIALAVIINLKPIMDGILFEAHDVWLHLFWLDQFFHQLSEGILYPRWLATANYGLGSPAFVFYPPLIYFLGSLARFALNIGTMPEFILLQTASVAAAGLAAYFSWKDRFGRLTAFVTASFYALSPYLMFDCYIRAALTESWTFTELPLIFYATDRALDDAKHLPLLVLLWSTLVLTNIPITVLALIIWSTYVSLRVFVDRGQEKITVLALRLARLYGCLTLSFACAAFYFLPAFSERSYINANVWLKPSVLDTTYGGAGLAKNPELIPLMFYVLVSGFILAAAATAAWKILKEPMAPLLAWLGVFLIQAFLISGWSRPLWVHINVLQYVQFAWRGLVFVSLINATFFAWCMFSTLKLPPTKRLHRILCLVMLAQFLISNGLADFLLAKFRRGLNGTEPQMISNQTDMKVYAARASTLPELMKSATWFPEASEYAPVIQKTHLAVPEPRPTQPPVPLVFSDALTQVRRWTSYDRQISASATTQTKLKIRTFYFPGWTAYIDGQRVAIEQADDGLIQIDLPTGLHQVEVRFERTIWERLGILLSSISYAAVLLWFAATSFTKRNDRA